MRQGRCTLRVRGLDCPSEVPPLRAALEGTRGVLGLDFDPPAGTMTVVFDPELLGPAALAARVTRETGMAATALDDSLPVVQPETRLHWMRWGPMIASGLALAAGLAASWLGGSARLVWVAHGLAIALASIELLPRALAGLRRGRLDVHALMTLAIAGALGIGQVDEAATVAFLFLLSEALEGESLRRARRSVGRLLELAPAEANQIEPDGSTRRVEAKSLGAGDRILVRAGDPVPIDGMVIRGRSSVDERVITGESLPVLKEEGARVYAGTVNGEGALEVEAERVQGESIVARAAEQVRASQAGRSGLERTVERFARVYTPAVVLVAVAVMVGPPLFQSIAGASWVSSDVWRTWIFRGLVVLVASCPCALVIATPVAVVGSLAAAARRGVLIKGGRALESLGRLRTLAFDKTGTLTRGEPAVVEVRPVGSYDDASILRVAAAVGDRGSHLVGRAIARHARELLIEVPLADDYEAVPGMGATAMVGDVRYHVGSHRYLDASGVCHESMHAGLASAEHHEGTTVGVTNSERPLGWIRLSDPPRPEAKRVLDELRSLGVGAVMLTGDNPTAARAIAERLPLQDVRAGLLPEEKVAAVVELGRRAGPVGMVGDGVNDAPALAAADLGIAAGGAATGAALDTAEVVLLGDGLDQLPWAVSQGRRTLACIRQNVALALITKALVLALAVAGRADLWMAIAADLGTTLVVILNSLRLARS